MSVKIGSARSSFGNTTPGDQSGGREVSTQSWYKHSKGWYVLRPKDATEASNIAYAMGAACANDKIGYSQETRGTLYTEVKTKGFDPAKASKAVNTDCSALVRVCCCYAGITVKNFTTADEVSVLMATGRFEKLTSSKYTDSSDYLCKGDILVTRTKGHTAVVLTDGPKATTRSTAVKKDKVVVNEGTWNVRRAAGLDERVMDTVHGGEVLEVIDVSASGWYHVSIPNG